jgi:ADP-ribose pyrophosphatase
MYLKEGKKHEWCFASREGNQDKLYCKLTTGRTKPDAITIVPFYKVNDTYNIVVTRELRPVLGGYEYAFPAGLVDDGETDEQAARRELHEETGLTVKKVFAVSPLVYSSAGMTDECQKMVFCEVEGQPSRELQEEQEEIEIYIFSLTRLGDLALGLGEFKNVMIGVRSWAVLYMLYCMSKTMSPDEILLSMI